MLLTIGILSFATLISAILAITFRQRQSIKLYSIFKPLTTILIITIAIAIYQNAPNTYTTLILVSLFFSLIGDIFLINEKYFLFGLSSFLFAHIGFTIGFTSINGFSWNVFPIVVLIFIGVTFYLYLRKDLHKFSIPVAIYIIVILIMNWQAIGLLYFNQSFTFWGIAIASILFSFSDSIIAYNKFKTPFKTAEIIIHSAYWISIYIFTIAGINI